MPAKKKADTPADEPDSHTIPVPNEENGEPDNIHIAFPVVINIVKMAAMAVDGVHSVKDGADGIWETFGGRKNEKGIEVTENEAGEYTIKIHVVMNFGVELHKAARILEEHVGNEVHRMTGNPVARIDVYIDGVKEPTSDVEEPKDSWNPPHTD